MSDLCPESRRFCHTVLSHTFSVLHRVNDGPKILILCYGISFRARKALLKYIVLKKRDLAFVTKVRARRYPEQLLLPTFCSYFRSDFRPMPEEPGPEATDVVKVP